MENVLPGIMNAIEKNDYSYALNELDRLKGRLNGTTSKGIIDTLIQSTRYVARNTKIAEHQNTDLAKAPQGEVDSIKQTQVDIKNQLKLGRAEAEVDKELDKTSVNTSEMEESSIKMTRF